MRPALLAALILALLLLGCATRPANCSDGTAAGACSQYKPYFCDAGNLTPNAPLCGCYSFQVLDSGQCRSALDCNGATHGHCAPEKPLFCNDGKLISNSSQCGCPEGSVPSADGTCRARSDCEEGTRDTACSIKKPYYCFNGTLAPKATQCGCANGYVLRGERCIDLYPPENYTVDTWRYKSRIYSVMLGFNSRLLDLYASQPREYKCAEPCPADWEKFYYRQFINDTYQQILIGDMISQVNLSTRDGNLMGLMSFVEAIPYDYSALLVSQVQKYPYETLYTDLGVCSDKTLLGADIAVEMGYGVALFVYDKENHMALGLKCPRDLSNYDSGYCFLEMTSNCSRLTDNAGNYTGIGTLSSAPRILVISDGAAVGRDTVMGDVNALNDFRNAKAQMENLSQLMEAAKSDPARYNSYVDSYNNYVGVYNAYIQCD